MIRMSSVILFEFLGKDYDALILIKQCIRYIMSRLNPTNDEVDDLKDEIDEDGNGEIEFNEFLAIMNSTKLRQMQAVDNREGRLRRAFSKIEGPDGRIRREDLVKLLTVSI